MDAATPRPDTWPLVADRPSPRQGHLPVAAVVVHYHRETEVLVVVEDLLANGVSGHMIVLVDNGSTDDFASTVGRRFPAVTYLPLDNPGYAAAVNRGVALHLERGRVEDVLVCTHEVRLLGTAVVATLQDSLSGDVGCVGPLLLNSEQAGTVWSAGGRVSRVRQRVFNTGKGDDPAGYDAEPRDVGWLDGACMLLSMRAWQQTGGLEESFFLYMEETDLHWRLRTLGWRVRLVPRAQVSQSAGTLGRYLAVRNRTMLLKRNGSHVARVLWAIETMLGLILGLRRRGRSRSTLQRFHGYQDGCTGRLRRGLL